jgi:hypothetical protein
MVNAYLYIVFIIGVCVFTSLCDYSFKKMSIDYSLLRGLKKKSSDRIIDQCVCVTKKKKKKKKKTEK